jgi:hypothetical protein
LLLRVGNSHIAKEKRKKTLRYAGKYLIKSLIFPWSKLGSIFNIILVPQNPTIKVTIYNMIPGIWMRYIVYDLQLIILLTL